MGLVDINFLSLSTVELLSYSWVAKVVVPRCPLEGCSDCCLPARAREGRGSLYCSKAYFTFSS